MAYNFDRIAKSYDRLNRLMTLGVDLLWRTRAVRGLHGQALDVACGTGDMVVSLVGQGCEVTGVDISEEMMAIAREKCPSARILAGNAEHLPFEDCSFDAVTCAFGVRNFVHLDLGLREMMRVLKPGGRMVILELATPDSALVRPFYNLYTRRIIPWLGQHLAGSREAYTYLPRSIEHFPKGDAFLQLIQDSGYRIQDSCQRKLTFGVCRMYTINKEAAA